MVVDEGRSEQRYEILRRIEGTLGDGAVTLVDIGERGLHLQHESPARLGSESIVEFSVADAKVSVRLPGFVVWSRFADPSDPRPYRSGVRLDDPDGVLKDAIDTLLEVRAIRPEEESIERKRQMLEARARTKQQQPKQTAQAPRLPEDVILVVKQAHQRLHDNPEEIVRWYNRAKFSLNDAGEQIRARDDVLAVWEYLERSVELSIVARILNE